MSARGHVNKIHIDRGWAAFRLYGEGGDGCMGCPGEIVGRGAKHVARGARSGPDDVKVQKPGIEEGRQGGKMPKRCNAANGEAGHGADHLDLGAR